MTTIERIRTYLDDPSLDAKYSNDFLVRQVIEPEMVNIITAINQKRDEPIICKFSLNNMTTGTDTITDTHIELPPNVGIIHRICAVDANGDVTDDIAKRDETDPRGPGWSLDGRELYFRPDWTPDTNGYEVWYTPSGDFAPHYSAAGSSGNLSDSALVLTLDTTPDIGGRDPRESAYVGGVLRCWNTANTIVEERVITAHDVSANTVTVRKAFSLDVDDGTGTTTVRYEIVPEFMGQIWQAVSIAGAMNLGAARNISEKHMSYLKEQYAMILQTVIKSTSNRINDNSVAPENSILYTMLQRVRWGLPENVESEMSNDYIMRYAIQPKLAEVLMMVNARSDSQIVIRHSLALEGSPTDIEYYNVPPNIYKALRVAKTSATGAITNEIRQRDENDPNGTGWRLEGNRLSIRPLPTGDDTEFDLWYVPSGDFMPHYAKDGTMGGSGTVLTMSTGGLFARQLGNKDKRDHGYNGATLRIFESNGSISERTITSHSASGNTVTVSEAFTTTSGTVAYEITMPWMNTIMSAVVSRAILELMTLKGGMSETDLAVLSESAKSAVTSAMLACKERNSQNFVPNTDSALHMILEKTKTIIDDVAKELDYSDDFIFRHGIVPEYSRVMSRIQNTSTDYVISEFDLTTVKDQQYYTLPASIGEIIRIVDVYSDGRVKSELMPRSQYSSRGPNWHLEGNTLSIRPYPTSAETFKIMYIPTTDVKPHYADDGLVDGDILGLTLSSGGWGSQMLGDLDRRLGIYKGCILRVLPASGLVEERVITEYNETTRNVSFRSALTTASLAGDTLSYEIVPTHFNAVAEAVAQAAAMNLLVAARRVTRAQHTMLLSNFKSAMKTAMDHFTFMQNRVPKKYERDTVDNKNRYGGLYGIR